MYIHTYVHMYLKTIHLIHGIVCSETYRHTNVCVCGHLCGGGNTILKCTHPNREN